MNYSYCFVVLSGKVTVWEMTDGQLRLEKNRGLESFPFTDENELWTWWKKVTSYASGEKVDFVVLTDDDLNWQFGGFSFTENTVWNRRALANLQNHWNTFGQVEVCNNGKNIVLKQGGSSNVLQLKLRPSSRVFLPIESSEPSEGNITSEKTNPERQPPSRKRPKPTKREAIPGTKEDIDNGDTGTPPPRPEKDAPQKPMAVRSPKKGGKLKKPSDKSQENCDKGDPLYEYLRKLKEQDNN